MAAGGGGDMDGAGAGAGGLGDSAYPNYAKELATCRSFLEEFRPPAPKGGAKQPLKYASILLAVSKRRQTRVDIELDDLVAHGLLSLAEAVEANVKRYDEIFSLAVDELLETAEEARALDADMSVHDVILHHRRAQLASQAIAEGREPEGIAQFRRRYPPALLRRYELRFIPRSESKAVAIRELKASQLGHLVKVQALVLRASDVKPIMNVATYTCDLCGYELFQEVMSRAFMPLSKCVSEVCAKNGVEGRVHMQTRACRFSKHQEIRVQELADQVPVGRIPRSMTLVVRGELTREMAAGDVVALGGAFLPTPFTGFQAIRAGLTADTYLEVHWVHKVKKAEGTGLDPAAAAALQALVEESEADPAGGAYAKLSRSIAPEIYGHEDVKKALLLQLVGGVTRVQADGMRTRGDINICLMGDPGVAKSQLLKHISKVAPRCVYTTGKGSSGVGLTAAVVPDPVTRELTLEGGALVLADNGICCIDEFDKMEESDRTAIHEVMEQQTVSIAKAGITTTLNARTAILAAANPRYGRYYRNADRDPHKALLKNINLPAALLSRFDLMFLLLDETDAENDTALGRHVTHVHAAGEAPPLDFEPYQPVFIRQYINVARHIQPVIPASLSDFIAECYVEMRRADKEASDASGTAVTTTARQLLSILRLATARARLDMRDTVTQADVEEAVRLTRMSRASVTEAGRDVTHRSPMDRVWDIMRSKMRTGGGHVPFAEARSLVLAAGLKEADFEAWLEEYSGLGIVMVNPSRTRIDAVA